MFLPYIGGITLKQKLTNIRKKLQRLAAWAGMPTFRPHDLRHSRAVDWLKSGMDVKNVSELLGHTSIDTTAKIYGRLRPEDRTDFVERGSTV